MKRILCTILCLCMVLSCVVLGAAAEEKPTLRVLMDYCNFDPNENPSAKVIEELTGYHVEYDTLPAENSLSKLNAILAAREPYDIIILTYANFSNTVGLGAYQTLNDLLDAHGAALLSGTDESLWTNTTIDGEIKGVPYRLSNENYTSGLRVRTDLMASAGIEKMPETADELYAFFKAVKDELGLIPLTGSGAVVDEIASAFGISNTWNVTENGIRNRATTEGAKEYVEFMNKLYTEGLIDSEWAQNTTASAQEKFFSGKALAYRVYWWDEPTATSTITANFPEATFDYLPPLQNAAGESGMPINRGSDMVVVIPKVAKNAQAAIEFMNAKVADSDIFRKLVIGEEGVHYRVIGENEYEPIQPAFGDERMNSNVFLTGTITADYGVYWAQTRVRKNETLYAEFLKMQANVENATIYYDPTTFMSPSPEFTELAPSVNTFVNDTMLQMIVGARDIAEWDEFIQEYYDMGGEQLEAMLNEWWDANRETVEPFVKR